MLDGIKMYKKTILRFFLQLKRPEYLIYAPFETIYHTVHCQFYANNLHYPSTKGKTDCLWSKIGGNGKNH